ncbi:MAG: PAS domain S-box protein [Alphaproteobacteria bacterium]|nr:PAS domain S-box protein [Alphaproteobacteria bacterium]
MAGSLDDISERVDTQIKLKLSEEKYRLLVNGIVDCGIYWLDINGYVSSWNTGAEKLKGYCEEEIIGQHFSIFFTEIDKTNKIPEQILTIAKNEGRYEGTGERVRKGGEIFSVHVILDPIHDERGTILGFAKISRDVTERERLIEKLTESNIELESFAYAASHDLKALLRVIDNASRWLEEDLAGHLDQESLENMQLLRSRVSRMGKLLDDMLEYSLIGSKITSRPMEMIQGDVLIKDVPFLLAPPSSFSITYDKRFEATKLPKFFIQRVLMNLISNAIKHHDKKEGNIFLSLEEDNLYYTITVEDDGPGISSQFHAQVFKMFHTLKPRDKAEGSGMGLAMVKKQVEHFGGSIALESEEGKGCRFRFSWPKKIMPL